ncbi:MAG: 50S ribosomal protein L14e [Candidatus Iainarchaeum archaeon]|uniref:50S ribosomal protein L14e n=1 Tax=Candidatus Iainarchaeum sp. TaxID=3101447 RepID=A0A497JHM3_9ARCH|nr:MAG: 50S ribosomal protein L14e [Candidatus Diapherotrites archaeon]
MAAIEPGRVCYKTRGREAGKKVVVLELQNLYATVVGKGGKKEKCNIRHLFPLKEKIDVNVPVEEIIKKL